MGQERAELVAVNRPMWGNSISAPASWDAFEPDHLQVQQPCKPYINVLLLSNILQTVGYGCLAYYIGMQSQDCSSSAALHSIPHQARVMLIVRYEVREALACSQRTCRVII